MKAVYNGSAEIVDYFYVRIRTFYDVINAAGWKKEEVQAKAMMDSWL